jgi:hypothetical protein
MRLKRLQTAAMVVMVIFFLINFYSSFISKRIFAILVFWDFLKRSTPVLGGSSSDSRARTMHVF